MDGKVVVITGASRGIGAAAAQVFAAAGAKVALLARSSAEIDALAAEIGPQAMALTVDVGDWEAMAAAIASVEAAFGPVDVLINNAGVIAPISGLAESTPSAWMEAITINLGGVYNGMRAVLPAMIARGAGTILTISSGAAHSPLQGWSHYCASKAGAAMLTRSAHLEAGDSGLRIMGLSPGTVATQMQKDIKASGVGPVAKLNWEDHVPADWPARTLLWMCSAQADSYLGQEISLRDPVIREKVGLQ
ncbi:MAG TPA: short-chain dehydrogenase [Rhodobacteraceae bacterium]|jgi:NAD(P)-dependent dehydrogenase (short-subunit alcohol dehydrogenase family)|nr:short-chain dehydrogenase [Paracoccaceae bacterium]